MVTIQSAQKKVWIIDDNICFCVQLVELLNESTVIKEVLTYSSCESALKALSEVPCDYPDVILLDVYFSKTTMDGLSAIKLIKKKTPESKIIILTAIEEEINARLAFKMGANGFLIKSDSDLKIIKAIELSLYNVSSIESNIATTILPKSTSRAILNYQYKLTLREKEIINLLSAGFKRPKIGNTLSISTATVNTHLRNIHSKLDVSSDIEIISKLYKE